jgi:hypothetical protein
MNNFWKFIRQWGHFGFLGFGSLYMYNGDYGMASMMFVLFIIDEAANHIEEKMKNNGKS